MTSPSADNEPGTAGGGAARPGIPPDTKGSAYFQLALAGVVVPVVGWVLTIILAIRARALAKADPEQRVWARRLTGLALVDVLVFVATIALITGNAALPRSTVAAPPPPRIGVELAEDATGALVRVVGARPGSPADRAGIKVGDTIESVDDQRVSDHAQLTRMIAARRPGEPRVLEILRDGERLRIRVVPALPAASGPRRSLFQRDGPSEPLGRGVAALAAAWGAVVVLLALTSLAARGRYAGTPSPGAFWITFVGVLAVSDVTLVAVNLAASTLLGGSSLGGALVALAAGSATLLILAALFRRRLGFSHTSARAPTLPTVVVGVAYLFAGAARVGILLAGLGPLLRLSRPDPGQEIQALIGPSPDPVGIALLIFAATVLAPIGEETLFRGVLLPWLGRWMRPDTAVWLSAILFGVGHLRYGVYLITIVVYGVVLGWARLRTGNLRASILLHMIINAVAVSVALTRS